MRPLPRLHAVTDAAVLALDDFAARAAAIAAAGPAVALHARNRAATGAELTAIARRLTALARPPEAAVFVNARPDIAAALDAQGLQLGGEDLAPRAVRQAFPRWRGWIGASVHSAAEAGAAEQEGADFLLAGPVYPTGSHPGRPALGLAFLEEVAKRGLPVVAIGGVTPERCAEIRDAGAWGAAAISALWLAADAAAAAMACLSAWTEPA
ncbi:MAG: thiamine phosphate synthase [Gemmatimonadota bacterium]|nr:thiamine phosphate synthase [Gemmatimonadota bacterium]